MPIDYSQYAPNWLTEIRPAIMARAGERRDESGFLTNEASCEWCAAPNHRRIVRFAAVDFREVHYGGITKMVPTHDWYFAGGISNATLVVLTIAHLDRDKANNDPANLAALCQRCHLAHDMGQHVRNRKYGRGHVQQPKLF
jgi:hypothetical protein